MNSNRRKRIHSRADEPSFTLERQNVNKIRKHDQNPNRFREKAFHDWDELPASNGCSFSPFNQSKAQVIAEMNVPRPMGVHT